MNHETSVFQFMVSFHTSRSYGGEVMGVNTVLINFMHVQSVNKKRIDRRDYIYRRNYLKTVLFSFLYNILIIRDQLYLVLSYL